MSTLDKIFIGIPILNRADLLDTCLSKIDVPADVLIVNNNSVDPQFHKDMAGLAEKYPFLDVRQQERNIGVAASWNFIIKMGMGWGHEIIFIGSMDTFLRPGALRAALDALLKEPSAGVWHINCWNFFVVTLETVKRVGWFDENFYPAYEEDVDYSYRCSLAGVPRMNVEGPGADHVGSATLGSNPEYAAKSQHTHFQWNRTHYMMKWGGYIDGEVHKSPYGRDDKDWRWWPDPGGSIAHRDWDAGKERLR